MRARYCVIFLALLLAGVLPADAQQNDGGPRLAGMALSDVLDAYRERGFRILYSSDLVKPWMKVRQEPPGDNPEERLANILADHGLELQRRRTIWLIVGASGEQEPAEGGVISGIVRDGTDGSVLAGARVRLPGAGIETTSAERGNFWLAEIPPGDQMMLIEADGFETARIDVANIAAGKTIVRNVRMKRKPNEIETVVVHASRYALRDRQSNSYSVFDRDDLENLPVLGREPLRAMARLPGTASNGVSARTNIRGGEEDEVLVLFDGLALYEPYHLKDFQSVFSVLDARLVDELEVFTGSFPAQYGDRLSGVIDITPVRPTDPRHHEIAIDLFNVSALSSGTLGRDKGEWLVSARRGTLDLFLDIVNSSIGDPAYFDVFGQFRYKVADNIQLTTSLMHANDSIRLTDSDQEDTQIADADYSTTHAWMSLTHDLSKELSYRTQLALINVDNDRRGDVERPDEVIGSVSDKRKYSIVQLKQDWVYAPTDDYRSLWGFDLRRVDGKYDYSSSRQFIDFFADLAGTDDVLNRELSARPDGSQMGFYISNRWRMTDKLTGELGLRWDRQNYTIQGGDEQTSPRASVLFEPTERTALRAGWGRFYQAQGIHELQIEDGVTSFLPAQLSEHRVLGLSHQFENDLNLRFEIYDKRMDRLRPRFENLFSPLELLPELEPDRVLIAPDSAEARGAELLLSREHSEASLSWWASASFSKVEDTVQGTDVARSWDQRRSYGFGIDLERGKWTLTLAGRVRSGWPTTEVFLVPEAQTDGSTAFVPVMGERNAARLSGYRSYDFRASRRQELEKGGAFTFFAEINNLTNHKNACCVDYSLENNDDGSVFLDRKFDNWLGTIPSVGVIWEF